MKRKSNYKILIAGLVSFNFILSCFADNSVPGVQAKSNPVVSSANVPVVAGKVDNQQVNQSKDSQQKSQVSQKQSSPKSALSAVQYYNLGVAAQKKKDIKAAQKYYTQAINKAVKNKNIRSKAFQNLGVVIHQSAKAVMMKKPEECLKILDKAEVLYKEAMRYDPLSNGVSANQQILINDRKLAKKIIKMREELKKRRAEAKEKTRMALNKQKDTNKSEKKLEQDKLQGEAIKDRENAQDAMQKYLKSAQENQSRQDIDIASKAGNDLKNAANDQNQLKLEDAEENLQKAYDRFPKPPPQQNQQNQQNQQKNQQNKDNKGGKNNQNKQQNKNDQNQNKNQNNKDNQNKNKNDQQKKQQNQQKQNQARDQVQNALNKQQQANQEKNQQQKQQKQNEADKQTQQAQQAMQDYKDQAQKNNSQQDKEKAEQAQQHLDKAQQAQEQNQPKKAEDELKKALKSLGKPEQDKQQPKLPLKQQAGQPQHKKYNDKKIDPKQAEALLKMMANEEKSLRDKRKEDQKKAYGIAPVEKDW